MAFEVTFPSLGEDAGDEAEVSFWYVDEGQSVDEGADMVEMVTDKAAFTLPAPASGTIKEIFAKEGAKVKVGEILALMED
jgi:pyruvate/2-oxoglutarate dehydrogenase complex dihydrolipoamide acyltransferase (E2) component